MICKWSENHSLIKRAKWIASMYTTDDFLENNLDPESNRLFSDDDIFLARNTLRKLNISWAEDKCQTIST
jgi:hypothetical protein